MTTTTVGVVDDHEFVLTGIGVQLAAYDEVELINSATSMADYLAGPVANVTLLDLRLGDGTSPAENVRTLIAAGSAVLIISSFSDLANIRRAANAGARGYMLKSAPASELLPMIQRVVQSGLFTLSPDVTALMRDVGSEVGLTPREREVADLHSKGVARAHIAKMLSISESTVKNHLAHIASKVRENPGIEGADGFA